LPNITNQMRKKL